MGSKEENSVNNNNNNNAFDKKRREKSDGDSHRGNQNAIILGLIGGIVALLIKSYRPSNSVMIESNDPSLYRGMHGLKSEYDLIVVGSGLSGKIFQN